MQVATYEAALRFLHGGSTSAALNRVLSVAQQLSRCQMVAVIAIENDNARIVSSLNVPYSVSQTGFGIDDQVVKHFSESTIITNLNAPMFRRTHPLISQIHGIKFVANVPIKLPMLPYNMALICMDADEKKRNSS